VFKEIDDSDGQYSISDEGVVISHGNGNSRKEKVMKTYTSSGSLHQRVDLRINGAIKKCSVHRLVANAFIPKIEGCNVVNHKDNDPTNNKVDNLEWTTPLGNVHHYYFKIKNPIAYNIFEYIANTLT